MGDERSAFLEAKIQHSFEKATKCFIGQLNTPAMRARIAAVVKDQIAQYDQMGIIVPRLSVLVHLRDATRIIVVSNDVLRRMWNSDELEDWEIVS